MTTVRSRATVVCALLVAACGGGADTAAGDSAAMAPPPPAALTAADIAGSWDGRTMPVGSDSVLSSWVAMSTSDSTGVTVTAGTTDTVPHTVMFSGDSMVVMSAPHRDAAPPSGTGQMVVFRAVGRMQDGRLTGTTAIMLAEKPDSVVFSGRWDATRRP
jgi:hypothetical protein